MEEIKLSNKDYRLVPIDSITYQLRGTWEHLRIGMIPGYPNSYSYITPEGGPCIALDDTFRGVKGKVIDIREVKGTYLVTIK